MKNDADPIEDLVTVRDWIRYATSKFTHAKLAFGHGTQSAFDEAVYLTLATLHLPIDTLDPWLDARLTRSERGEVFRVIEQRITTRKPAPYLTNEAWIQGHSFYVDERVIVPRSYIGELLCTTGLSAAVADPEAVTRVLDLCTGSGCLAILAAMNFPNAEVVGVDISEEALEVARRNVADYGLADRVSLVRSDLFEAVKGRFDVIISNPPYVTQAAVDAFPPEYKAEPQLAHLGGDDGLDLVRRIIAGAGKKLERGGVLVVEVGQTREALEADYPALEFIWLDTEESEGEVFMLEASALV